MTQHKIKFYPVGNGDTVQLVLSNGRRILFDYRHCQAFEDNEVPEIDLKKELKRELNVAKRDYFDVVAFTHADSDHIQGCTDFFHLECAKKYQGEGRIKIKELWLPAAMMLEPATKDEQSDERVILTREARCRLLKGEGIRIFSKPPQLATWLKAELAKKGESESARDHLFTDAGKIVPGFSLGNDDCEFFCHSPFKDQCDGEEIVRNEASLMFNIKLSTMLRNYNFMEIGDTEWECLKNIVAKTKKNNNHHQLAWDVLNIPHHCSYKALNEDKGEKITIPDSTVNELLTSCRDNAYIVSCSDPIPDTKEAYNQGQPPHIQARKAYQKILTERNGRKFLVTMEQPNQSSPRPIVIVMGEDGMSYDVSDKTGIAALPNTSPPRAG